MSYPNLFIDPEMLNYITKFDENKKIKYKTEKREYENISKSPKIDKDYYI